MNNFIERYNILNQGEINFINNLMKDRMVEFDLTDTDDVYYWEQFKHLLTFDYGLAKEVILYENGDKFFTLNSDLLDNEANIKTNTFFACIKLISYLKKNGFEVINSDEYSLKFNKEFYQFDYSLQTEILSVNYYGFSDIVQTFYGTIGYSYGIEFVVRNCMTLKREF